MTTMGVQRGGREGGGGLSSSDFLGNEESNSATPGAPLPQENTRVPTTPGPKGGEGGGEEKALYLGAIIPLGGGLRSRRSHNMASWWDDNNGGNECHHSAAETNVVAASALLSFNPHGGGSAVTRMVFDIYRTHIAGPPYFPFSLSFSLSQQPLMWGVYVRGLFPASLRVD